MCALQICVLYCIVLYCIVSLCYIRAISERFRDKGLVIKHYVNSSVSFTFLAVLFINVVDRGADQRYKSCGQWTDLYSAASVIVLAITTCMAGHYVLPVFFLSFLSFFRRHLGGHWLIDWLIDWVRLNVPPNTLKVILGTVWGHWMVLNWTEPGLKVTVQNLGVTPHKLPIFGHFYVDIAPCSVIFLTHF